MRFGHVSPDVFKQLTLRFPRGSSPFREAIAMPCRCFPHCFKEASPMPRTMGLNPPMGNIDGIFIIAVDKSKPVAQLANKYDFQRGPGCKKM